MNEVRAPGLSGDWLNGWLAALGITVLVDGTRLRWSEDRVPVAILARPSEEDMAEAIAERLPSAARLGALAIARPFPRIVGRDGYRMAAEVARAAKDFSLGSSVTDLAAKKESGELAHSRFDVPAPRGQTLWDRLERCRQALAQWPSVPDAVRATLAGGGMRVDANGLGFDFKRIPSGDQPGKYVDPVVECLAFFGLAFFPVRGDGRNEGRTRGWRLNPPSFSWPTWSAPLDRWAIDALVGLVLRESVARWRGLGMGITEVFEAVRFQKTGDMDQTAGLASRRVR